MHLIFYWKHSTRKSPINKLYINPWFVIVHIICYTLYIIYFKETEDFSDNTSKHIQKTSWSFV